MHIFVNFSQIFNSSHHWKGHGSALKNISIKTLKELIQLQNVNRIISNLTKISCSVITQLIWELSKHMSTCQNAVKVMWL